MVPSNKNFVYVLTNPAMDGLVNIGGTDKSVEDEVKNLSRSKAAPIPFVIYYACTVEDADYVVKQIHRAFGFGEIRTNPKRDFFKINPDRIVDVLRLVAIEDVTPSSDSVDDKVEQKALNDVQRRKSNINLRKLGIEPDEELIFYKAEKGEFTAKVLDSRKIEFDGVTTSLSDAAKTIFKKEFDKTVATVNGPLHWMYEGETLSDRRIRIEEEEDN